MTQIWSDIPCSWIGRITTVKVTMRPQSKLPDPMLSLSITIMNFRILIQEFFKGKETVLFSNTKSQLIHFGSYFTELKNAERLPWWSNG